MSTPTESLSIVAARSTAAIVRLLRLSSSSSIAESNSSESESRSMGKADASTVCIYLRSPADSWSTVKEESIVRPTSAPWGDSGNASKSIASESRSIGNAFASTVCM